MTRQGLTGKGVVDDGPALEELCARLPSGSELFFPKGTYRINDATIPNKGLVFRGEGIHGAKIVSDSGYAFTTSAGFNPLSLERFSFEGCGVTLAGGTRGGTYIRQCYFDSTLDYAIKTDGMSVITGTIYDCEFKNCRAGIGFLHSACDLWLIRECRFIRVDQHAVSLLTSGVELEYCQFENKNTDADRAYAYIWIGPSAGYSGGRVGLFRCRFGGEVGAAAGPPAEAILIGEGVGEQPSAGAIKGVVVSECWFNGRLGSGPLADSAKHAIRFTKQPVQCRVVGSYFSKYHSALVQNDSITGVNQRDNYYAMNSEDSLNHTTGRFAGSETGWTVMQ